MFGRIPDAIICILLGIVMLSAGDSFFDIPGQLVYALLSVTTAALCFAVAAFLTWPTGAR